jgi:hypothetical protein
VDRILDLYRQVRPVAMPEAQVCCG